MPFSQPPHSPRAVVLRVFASLAMACGLAMPMQAADLCTGYGPQAPRDIALRAGINARHFSMAPPATDMNLCNIHLHVQAEHSGPGFSLPAGDGPHGGFRCNDSAYMTAAEQADPTGGEGPLHGVVPGDTIEVHWVHTSCDVRPGEGLGACSSDSCANPELRVESQVFLVVNNADALQMSDFDYPGKADDRGLHQPRALPEGTGAPVVFLGSTTGPKYSEAACSPLQVTWSVRPQCARIDITSLHDWAESNVFKEDHAHGVRGLVRAPALLSAIE